MYFGVEVGKFLGFLLTERGIEANPEKCAAMVAMRSPTTVKEVQQLPVGWQHYPGLCPLEGRKVIRTSSVLSATVDSFGHRSARRPSSS